jgi:bacterioferritin-associated ferredoxin
MVCACEDVTLRDLDDAVARGFRDVESVKRYTGLGTGPCQGKSCLGTAMRHLAAHADLPPAAQVPFTARTPLNPLRLAELAGLPLPPLEPVAPMPSRHGPHPLQPTTPVPDKADVDKNYVGWQGTWPPEFRAYLSADEVPAAPAPLCPWPLNFLATPTLCVLVPRRAAEAHGVNMISLAFAGLFLPRGGSLAAALKAAGTEDPLALLEMVAGTAPQRG